MTEEARLLKVGRYHVGLLESRDGSLIITVGEGVTSLCSIALGGEFDVVAALLRPDGSGAYSLAANAGEVRLASFAKDNRVSDLQTLTEPELPAGSTTGADLN